MSGKFALIIGNTEYIDPGLAQLTAPGKDAEDFARVLKDQDICAFDDVKVLLNQSSSSVIEAIDEFFDQKKPDDLIILYFSGHGVRDELGALYLAVKNTNRFRLRSTAIKSDFIREAMDQSRSKREVLIMDCCNSGAFAQGTKAATGVSIGTATAFEAGYGRIILTASDSTQFAWEGNKVIGETDNSLFTHYLVEGLEGEADLDGDGRITVDEVYDYAYEKVRLATPKQTPSKFSSKQQGEIVLRQSMRLEDIKPVSLPSELIDEIEDTRPYVREAAVQKLEKILKGRNIGLARSARDALEKIAIDDNTTRRVSQMATQLLEAIRQQEQKAEEERKAREEAERLAVLKAEEERLAAEKAEAERSLAEQKAEEERKAKKEAKRLAALKAKEERSAREKAEVEQKAKQEAERLLAEQKVEQERKAQEEAERKAKQDAERLLAQQKAEEERVARVEAERLAALQAKEERNAKAKIEAELLAEEKRLAEERAEAEAKRLAAQRAKKKRLAREKAEKEAAELADHKRVDQEPPEKAEREAEDNVIGKETKFSNSSMFRVGIVIAILIFGFAAIRWIPALFPSPATPTATPVQTEAPIIETSTILPTEVSSASTNVLEEVWRFVPTEGKFASDATAVTENVAIITGSDGDSNIVFGLDAETGKQLWKFKLTSGTGIMGITPATLDNLAFFGGQHDDKLYAIDVHTGDIKWEKSGMINMFASSPIISNGVLYVNTDDSSSIWAIDPLTGQTIWVLENKGSVGAMAFSEGTLVKAGYGDYLIGIDAESGKIKWESPGFVGFDKIFIQDGIVFATYSGDRPVNQNGEIYNNVAAFKVNHGQKLWEQQIGSKRLYGGITLADGVLYVSSRETYIIYSLDANTGRILKDQKFPVALDNFAVANGVIYACAYDNNALYAITPKVLDVLWTIDIGVSRCGDLYYLNDWLYVALSWDGVAAYKLK